MADSRKLNNQKECECCGKKSGGGIHMNYVRDGKESRMGACITCLTASIKLASPDSLGNIPDNQMDLIMQLVLHDSLVFSKMVYYLLERKEIFMGMKNLKGDEREINQNTSNNPIVKSNKNNSPKEIDFEKMYTAFDKHIIGQQDAKESLSNVIDRRNMSLKDPSIKKINSLLIGPTACGKTELVRVMAKTLNVPMIEVDCASLTPEGYKGKSISEYMAILIKECGGDVSQAEKAIVYLDEFDKLFHEHGEFSSFVQSELLKMIEGSDIYVEISRGETERINTTNIIFVASGAFEYITKKKKIQNSKSNIGITKIKGTLEQSTEVTRDDLSATGVCGELMGRFTSIDNLTPMSEEMLKSVFCDVENSLLTEYNKIIKHKKLTYKLNKKEINSIVKEAFALGLGARSLRTAVERRLRVHMLQSFKTKTDKSLERTA